MDGVRTFKSFQKQTMTRIQKRAPRGLPNRLQPISGGDPNGERPSMVSRDLSGKPRIARTEILKKLEDNDRSKFVPKKVRGKKLGFKAENEASTGSDVGVNNPDDPMTSEKLKSVLQSGAVNFSGKEKEILGKILNG